MDVEFASDIDRFDFATEVTTNGTGRRLEIRSGAHNIIGPAALAPLR